MNSSILIIASGVIAVFMAITMIFIRSKASKKPTSPKKIILPPLFMSSGALMFVLPEFRLEWMEVVEVLVIGVIFSLLLVKTTKFEQKGGDIYLIPSKAFILVLIGLFIIRMIIKMIVGSHFSFGETSGMFFLLAFGMIISWRIAMLFKYFRLKKGMLKEMNME